MAGFFEASLDPSQPDTYDSVARKRKIAEMLLSKSGALDAAPIGSWTQGLAKMASAWIAGDKERQADSSDKSRDGAFTSQLGSLLMGGGGAAGPAIASTVASNGSGDGSAKPVNVSDPASPNLEPWQKGLLNAIAAPESGGAYDIRYTPKGGTKFSGFDQHPGVFEPGPAGPSSAAGRYQFTKTTWDGMGGGAFTPEAQDQRALQLAQQDYGRRTGRDLGADIQKNGLTPDILKTLGPTWAGLKDNPQKALAAYAATVGQGGAASQAIAQAAPVQVASNAPGLGYAPAAVPGQAPAQQPTGGSDLTPQMLQDWAKRNAIQPPSQEINNPTPPMPPSGPGGQVLGNALMAGGAGLDSPDLPAQKSTFAGDMPGSADEIIARAKNLVPLGSPQEQAFTKLEGQPGPAQPGGASPGAPVDRSRQLMMLAMDPRFSPQQRQQAMQMATLLQSQEKVSYQTDGSGNIIALDPLGQRPPQVVYKADVKPMAVKPGERLINPVNGQVIAGGAEGYRPMSPAEKQAYGVPADGPAFIGPDGKPSFGPMSVSVSTGNDKDYGKSMVEGLVADHKELQAGTGAAQTRLRDINAMQGALDAIQANGGTTGGMSPDKVLQIQKSINSGANWLGMDKPFDEKDLSDKEFLQKFNRQIAGAQAKGAVGSRVTNFEMSNYLKANPGLDMSVTGNQRLLGIQAQIEQRNVDLGLAIKRETARAVAAHQQPDPAKVEQMIQDYDEQHHIVDPVTKQDLTKSYALPEFQGRNSNAAKADQHSSNVNSLSSSALDRARAAIASGAPRDAVIQRLKASGIDPAGL